MRSMSASASSIGEEQTHRVQDGGRRRTVTLAPAAAGVHEHRAQTGPARPHDVDRVEIADVGGFGRVDPGASEGALEQSRIGLLQAFLVGVEDEVEVAREVEALENAADGAVR